MILARLGLRFLLVWAGLDAECKYASLRPAFDVRLITYMPLCYVLLISCHDIMASCRNRQKAPRRGRDGAAERSSPDLRLPVTGRAALSCALQRHAVGGAEDAYPQSGCMSQAPSHCSQTRRDTCRTNPYTADH